MGIVKTGIQAGAAYAVVRKVTKAIEANNESKRVNPHPPCNCPHCPYSHQAIYNGAAPGPRDIKANEGYYNPPLPAQAHGRHSSSDEGDMVPPYTQRGVLSHSAEYLTAAMEKRGVY